MELRNGFDMDSNLTPAQRATYESEFKEIRDCDKDFNMMQEMAFEQLHEKWDLVKLGKAK